MKKKYMVISGILLFIIISVWLYDPLFGTSIKVCFLNDSNIPIHNLEIQLFGGRYYCKAKEVPVKGVSQFQLYIHEKESKSDTIVKFDGGLYNISKIDVEYAGDMLTNYFYINYTTKGSLFLPVSHRSIFNQ